MVNAKHQIFPSWKYDINWKGLIKCEDMSVTINFYAKTDAKEFSCSPITLISLWVISMRKKPIVAKAQTFEHEKIELINIIQWYAYGMKLSLKFPAFAIRSVYKGAK